MNLFFKNKKKNKEKPKVNRAIKINLCPSEGRIEIASELLEKLKKNLIGRIVKKGDEINFNETRKDKPKTISGSPFEDIFDVFEQGFMGGFGFIVADTYPEGEVEITTDTKIHLEKVTVDEEGLPKSKVIKVKKLPNMGEFIEVNSIWDIKNLAQEGLLINRYEDKKQIIYFTDRYFYIRIK